MEWHLKCAGRRGEPTSLELNKHENRMFKTIIVLMFQGLKTYVEVKFMIITQMRQGWSIKLN